MHEALQGQLVRLVLVTLTAQLALAGLIIESDESELCNQALRDCNSRCMAPQSFLFMCNSGGNFKAPRSDCKCTPAPPAGVVTDGAGQFQLVQWPGPGACQGSTWLYDCAQYLDLQARANNMQGQAQDQASVMAAVAAAQAAAEAKAAAMAGAQQQMAAMQQQQQQAAGSSAAADSGTSNVPGLGSTGVPGLSEPAGEQTTTMNAVMTPAPAAAASTAGGNGMMGNGAWAMGTGSSMGPGSSSSSSLMMSAPSEGPGAFGHRHLLQALGASAASDMPLGVPTTQLGPACQQPIRGLITGANTGVWLVPNFVGVASVSTRGNDTLIVQLGGQGSSCVGAYKLLSGEILGLGKPVETAAPQPATSAASSRIMQVWSVGALLAVTSLWLLS